MTLDTEARRARLGWWRRAHQLPISARWALKLGLLALVVGLVCYPKVWLLPVWIDRMRDMNAMIDADHDGLAAIQADVQRRLAPGASHTQALQAVQQVIHERIPYAWDWDVWGVMDYLPTVGEVLDKGREDCDGRAVLAASVLKRMGYQTSLVSDIKHTWVVARSGDQVWETMGARSTVKTFTATDDGGTRVALSLESVENLVRGLAFGISVFPVERELIVLAAICLLTLHPRTSTSRWIIGTLLLGGSLALFQASHPWAGDDEDFEFMIQILATGLAMGGWFIMAFKRRGPQTQKSTLSAA